MIVWMKIPKATASLCTVAHAHAGQGGQLWDSSAEASVASGDNRGRFAILLLQMDSILTACKNEIALPGGVFFYSEEPYASTARHYRGFDGKQILSCPLKYHYMTIL